MKLDENVAAFGLFHLAFADLHQRLAIAVFCLKGLSEPGLQFQNVFNMRFSELLRALKKELKQIEEVWSYAADVQQLRKVCASAREIAEWRNPRTHPRVQMDDAGIAIFDARTLKPLGINADECMQKIEQAIAVGVWLEMTAMRLVREIKSDREWGRMIREAFRSIAQVSAQ